MNTGIHLPLATRAGIVEALRITPNAAWVARHVGGVSRVAVAKIARAERIKLARARSLISKEKRAKIVAALKVNPKRAVAAAKSFRGLEDR
jgi:hypothetical protein